VVTLQAVSGAGYPGVPSLDILETWSLSSVAKKRKWKPNPETSGKWTARDSWKRGSVSALIATRAISDGHLECVSLRLKKNATLDEVRQALRNFEVFSRTGFSADGLNTYRRARRRSSPAGAKSECRPWHGCGRGRVRMPSS